MQITEDVHHYNSLINTATYKLKDPLLSEGEKGELRAQLVSYTKNDDSLYLQWYIHVWCVTDTGTSFSLYTEVAIVEEGSVLYTNCSLGPECLAFIAVGVST